MRLDTGDERVVAKVVGADFELGNFVLDTRGEGGSGAEAARALLAEIDGVDADRAHPKRPRRAARRFANRQDTGRKFLPSNGGCAYIDLDHLELCIPEVTSAFDHAAATAAMLRIARSAQVRANSRLPDERRIQVLVNNSDGKSNSYGSHLSFLVSRSALADIVERRPHHLHFLATHQLSAMVYAGQGKVGAENGRPDVAYQLSQRADFLETLCAPQTTYRRPIVNSRDETLCGESSRLARLHVIAFDNTLCPGASVLKVGAMQIVLALLEAEAIDPRIAVDAPIEAAVAWSHDPELRTALPLAGGGRATAVEVQERILELALRGNDAGLLETVPRAGEILALWEDTLRKLAARDLDALAGRIDWVLKLLLLERARAQQPGLAWDAAELRYLDQIYGSLDPDEGLFWPHAASGLVEPWVGEDEVARFVDEPPDDTRAFARAMLLREIAPEQIVHIDWDAIVFEDAASGRLAAIALDDPLGLTRERIAAARSADRNEGRTDENPKP